MPGTQVLCHKILRMWWDNVFHSICYTQLSKTQLSCGNFSDTSCLKLQFEFSDCYEMMHKAWHSSSSSSNFISNKYMETSIYNTIALMITAMFTCTLLVATRKSRGLSSWLLEESGVPYCFSRSPIKFQGHTWKKIANFDPISGFSYYKSSLNSLMDLKWCTRLDEV